ncbi:MAG: hypothetical protein A2085_08700 [Gemmatimonadetes bacterium GWC2_71_10]|nr:MAG: hypothetical protein A2085_08700 [Gemmatimonadetes bacterium GWC2_71_10]
MTRGQEAKAVKAGGQGQEDQRMTERLAALGLRARSVRLTDNRSVMVSMTRNNVLRIHRGYATAPDTVLRAVVQFVSRGARRPERLAAQREILSFPVRDVVRVRRHAHAAPRPGDLFLTDRLALLFDELNRLHFDGRLPDIPIRLSGRMRTRLGQLCLDPDTLVPFEITMSRRHIERHGWDEARHTLLHELVHLWQHASGYPVDHGPTFRSKARAVGVAPVARRRPATARSRDRAALND